MTDLTHLRVAPGRDRAQAHGPRLDHRVALALIAVGGVAALGIWWQDTMFVSGLSGWLTNAGRITGLAAGYVIVVLLALMARIPVVERGVGADRLVRWHAMGGRYTISLAVAHTLLIIWGYAVAAHAGIAHETSTLLTSYPDVLMATVGTLLLVAVGVTSARAARKRMRYETWHFIHLYTYLAIALVFSHQFADGADFQQPPVRYLWAGLYIAVGAALLWYRFITPVRQAFRHQMRVTTVRREAPNIVSVYISGHHLDELRTEPGQFFRWRFLTKDTWWAANPYSLSAAPRDNLLRITVQLAGDHSAAAAALRPGVRVLAEGPYGAMTGARRKRRKVLLLGIGIGITPMRALYESMADEDVTLVYRARSETDASLAGELNQIAHQRGSRLHYLFGSRTDPAVPDLTSPTALQTLVPELAEHDVYLCGPDVMAEQVKVGLRAAGVPARHIHHESFTF